MKVLIIKTNPFEREGITTVVLNLYKFMNREDIIMDVVSPRQAENRYVEYFENNGSNFHVINRSIKHPFKYMNALKKLIKEHSYDIVHVHGNSHTLVLELLAAKWAGCRVRITHAHNTVCKYKLLNCILTPIFYKNYTHGLACGAAAGRFMYGKNRFSVINNGIDTNKFQYNDDTRCSIRQKYSIEDKKVIGHVGLFNEAKNQNYIIDIMKELSNKDKDFCVMLLGEGGGKQQVEEKVKSLGLQGNVLFVGSVDNVYDYLSAMDILLMPSLYEGLPLALIEAQASGLDCIISDRITKEVDKTGNVRFLPLEDNVNGWVEEILRSDISVDRNIKSKEAIDAIVENGYSIEAEAKKLKEYYLSALNE